MDERPQNPDLKPQLNVHRRTTQVNIALVVGVLLFLLGTLIVVFVFERNAPEVRNDQYQKSQQSP